MSFLTLALPVPAAVELQPLGFRDGLFRLGAAGTADAPITVETSTDLASWQVLFSTNLSGGALQLADPDSGTLPRRFYRAASPALSLRILSPVEGGTVSTARPPIELEFNGGTPDLGSLWLRANGNSLPVTFQAVSNRVTCLPTGDLPEGFVTLTAACLGTAGDKTPYARTRLTVLTGSGNLPPQARNDVANTTSGTPRNVAVLENDRDPNGGALRVTGAAGASHGEVSFTAAGVRYTPAAGFVGRDEFAYTIADPQGLTSTGQVFMVVTRTPARTVYVGNAGAHLAGAGPAFTNLSEAVAHLCAELAEGEHGRIVLRSGPPLRVDTLALDCDVEIEAEEGAHPRLEGTTIVIASPRPLLLAGLEFAAGTVQFDVRSDFAFLRSRVSGAVQLKALPTAAALARTGGAGGLPAPPPLPPGIDVAEVAAQAFEATGATAPGAVMQLRDNDIGDERTAMEIAEQAVFRARDNQFGNSENNLRLAVKSRVVTENNVNAGKSIMRGELVGESAIESRNEVAAEAEHHTSGGGKANILVEGARTDRVTYDYHNGMVLHQGFNNMHAVASYLAADGLYGASIDMVFSETRLQMKGLFEAQLGDHANVDLAFDAGNLQETRLRAGGRFNLRWLDTDVVGRFDLYALGPVAAAYFTSARFHGELEFKFSPSTSALLYLDAVTAAQNVDIQGADRGDFTSHLRGSEVSGGLGVRTALWAAARNSSVRHSVLPHGAGGGTIDIRDTRFLNTLGRENPVHLLGVKVPVRFEGNTVRGRNVGLTFSEVDAPVTIRSNVLMGCGIALDGDMENRGAAGILSQPYLVENNAITGADAQVGIAVQDLNNVMIRGNHIEARQPLMVSAGRACAEANTLSSTNAGVIFMLVGSGPNGPGILDATGTAIEGGIFPMIATVLPGGALRMAGHSLTNGFVSVTGDGEPAFAKFETNDLSMVNVTVMGNAHTWFARNRVTAGFVAIAPTGADSSTLLEGNDFTGCGLSVSQPGTVTARANTISMGGVSVGGATPGLLLFEGNTCAGAQVGTAEHGYARILGNLFMFSSVHDENPQGGLLNNPDANTGLDPESDISTDIDFNGNGCPDYPPGRDEKDEFGQCPEPGLPVPSQPPIPPAPAWPDFGP